MLYLESPKGVGFSYCDNGPDSCINTDVSTALDAYEFLIIFFQSYPEYKDNKFYITGESYAGIYIPMLMQQIMLDPLSPPPTAVPSRTPTFKPTSFPSQSPTLKPSIIPSSKPTYRPSQLPTTPSRRPTASPTSVPSAAPTSQPSARPSASPSSSPSVSPVSAQTAHMNRQQQKINAFAEMWNTTTGRRTTAEEDSLISSSSSSTTTAATTRKTINLIGAAIGNGCWANSVGTCGFSSDNIRIMTDFLFGHGMYSQTLRASLLSACSNTYTSSACINYYNKALDQAGDFDM